MVFWTDRNIRSLPKGEKQIPITLPVPFEITHIGDHWRPVKGPWLLLQPLLQLPKVLVCVVTDNDLLEGFTGGEKLINGGARANVNQEVSFHTTWSRGSGIIRGQAELKFHHLYRDCARNAPRQPDHPPLSINIIW